ncbi:hypothetical protein CMI47_10135 [Candidatus Pacearchaeota archaeon]|nr:hypothetical protein [Candidatus Pacearchaeota archaeon]|tara:strand:- start:4431 stop:4727 length:297 start_codon:yes stop_codon:yes gene_type:complete
MNVQVIYPAGQFGSRSDKTFTLKVPHEPSDDSHDILNTVWRYMNHVDGSRVENQLAAFQCRSMSVGDLAVIEGRRFLCEPVGWTEIFSINGMIVDIMG